MVATQVTQEVVGEGVTWLVRVVDIAARIAIDGNGDRYDKIQRDESKYCDSPEAVHRI